MENQMTQSEMLAKEVTEDFEKRQEERKLTERGWQLSMNFVAGNQYCDVNTAGELFEEDKKFYWQSKQAFNHIAPTVELRCSKLGRIRPALIVRAASDSENDRHSSRLSSAILAAMTDEIDDAVSQATVWSETCGTAFYKVIWDGNAGGTVGGTSDGRRLKCGAVKVCAVSPFEIYPASLSEESVDAQPSIIHAKAMPVEDIYSMYGVRLSGRDIEDLNGVRHGCELVIERYERPSDGMPQGRLTVVAGGELLFDGALPYVNGDDGQRVYPFIKQTSLPVAGCFFGTGVVARLIPVQRAYNAVKNRKHEFLNRISMGTVAVEDGSVDIDELIEDGLTPGKVIVYRQGAKPPEMLTLGSVPAEFTEEETSLLEEFAKVSGTGEITQDADSFSGVTSATGLQLLIEQDEIRMDFSYRQIKSAMRNTGRQILRLYRQFATDVRLLRYTDGEGKLSLIYFKGSDISSDDVVLEADNDVNLTPAQRRNILYEMIDRGLFCDENGKMSVSVKNKLLELMGYKGFEGGCDHMRTYTGAQKREDKQ